MMQVTTRFMITSYISSIIVKNAFISSQWEKIAEKSVKCIWVYFWQHGTVFWVCINNKRTPSDCL